MLPSATPATRNEGGCHQVPRLPRKVARRHGRPSAPKRATRASPVPQVPRLQHETKVDVTKCHAFQASGAPGDPAPKRTTRASPVLQVPRLLSHTTLSHLLSHTTLSHTIFNTQLCVAGVALGDIHLRFTW